MIPSGAITDADFIHDKGGYRSVDSQRTSDPPVNIAGTVVSWTGVSSLGFTLTVGGETLSVPASVAIAIRHIKTGEGVNTFRDTGQGLARPNVQWSPSAGELVVAPGNAESWTFDEVQGLDDTAFPDYGDDIETAYYPILDAYNPLGGSAIITGLKGGEWYRVKAAILKPNGEVHQMFTRTWKA